MIFEKSLIRAGGPGVNNAGTGQLVMKALAAVVGQNPEKARK
jgi:hypothetical protein